MRRADLRLVPFALAVLFANPLEGAIPRFSEPVVTGDGVTLNLNERPTETEVQIIGMQTVGNVLLNPASTAPPACAGGAGSASLDFTIDPSPGESVGDCVQLRVCQVATASVARAAANQGAEAGWGGPPTSFTCVNPQGTPTQLAFGSGTGLVRDPNGTPEILYGSTLIIQAPASPAALDTCESFLVQVGEEFRFSEAAGLGVWTNPPHGVVEAHVNNLATLELFACPFYEVPAASPGGLALFAVLLVGLALGLLALRRRRAA